MCFNTGVFNPVCVLRHNCSNYGNQYLLKMNEFEFQRHQQIRPSNTQVMQENDREKVQVESKIKTGPSYLCVKREGEQEAFMEQGEYGTLAACRGRE